MAFIKRLRSCNGVKGTSYPMWPSTPKKLLTNPYPRDSYDRIPLSLPQTNFPIEGFIFIRDGSQISPDCLIVINFDNFTKAVWEDTTNALRRYFTIPSVFRNPYRPVINLICAFSAVNYRLYQYFIPPRPTGTMDISLKETPAMWFSNGII